MNAEPFTMPVSRRIWDSRYRRREDGKVRDQTIEDTWRRVACALASVEPVDSSAWEQRFFAALERFRFLPGGRILAGAGTARRLTLFNCFVMGRLDDSLVGIFDALKEAALTMQQGGGIGCDFSTLRPRGADADDTGGVASGPVSFMRVWDSMCATLLATNARRGAMMATLSCDHPDIEAFVGAKSQPHELRHFNLSVLASDAFMQAIAADADWPLVFPCASTTATFASEAARAASRSASSAKVHRVVRARALWDCIMRANYDYAEPGVIFIDRVNAQDNLGYVEQVRATNPCGEIPLPPYGACDLGSLNLTQFIDAPFTAGAAIEWPALRATAAIAVRMLDNVYDLSRFPLPQQRHAAQQSRRIGIGITGLADAMVMLGRRYADAVSLDLAGQIMREVCHAAYRASIDLARDRGPFPLFEARDYLRAPFVQRLPDDIRAAVGQAGIRNSHLTAIAPAGSISLLANNVSSGLEPIFAAEYRRQVRQDPSAPRMETVVDYAVQRFRSATGSVDGLPPAFESAAHIEPEAQLAMQAALQPHVDNAISKTVAVPVDFPFERFRALFDNAYQLGLKGCTTFRPNPVTGAVIVNDDVDSCCALPR